MPPLAGNRYRYVAMAIDKRFSAAGLVSTHIFLEFRGVEWNVGPVLHPLFRICSDESYEVLESYDKGQYSYGATPIPDGILGYLYIFLVCWSRG